MKRIPKIMVCVTRQKTCERLIKIGVKISTENKGELSVVHVAKQGENILGNPKEGEALEYLFRISKEAGADMTVLRAERIVDTLVDFARKNEITIVVMGESPYSKSDTSIIRQLEVRLPDIEIKVIPA
ncbi:MAG: universal stress protein [Clostridia bacterium]